jgi:hypothetical protein
MVCSISRPSAPADHEGGGLPRPASESVSARLGHRVVSDLADRGGGGYPVPVGALLAGRVAGHRRLVTPKQWRTMRSLLPILLVFAVKPERVMGLPDPAHVSTSNVAGVIKALWKPSDIVNMRENLEAVQNQAVLTYPSPTRNLRVADSELYDCQQKRFRDRTLAVIDPRFPRRLR